MNRRERAAVCASMLGWVAAAAGVIAISCAGLKPLPPTTGIDIARDVQCVEANLARGVTDYGAIALDCRLAGAQVVSDLVSTLDTHAMRKCSGSTVTSSEKR